MVHAGAGGVVLENVNIAYAEKLAVADANLDIPEGSFFTLLGPSGCGKTTLLRAIAGFIRQSSGNIFIGNELINDVPAHLRDAGMVFQNYAIFPHLSVEHNVAYGLKARRITGHEAQQRVEESLAMVDLLGYEKRLPKELSGGQQQRVVIARAIATRPRVLLMDEPLANLDAKLRVRLRGDLKRLQQELGTTTIYVTHDQEEALSLSDQVAGMSHGRIEQIGTPVEVYNRPKSLSVGNFVGEGNFLQATLRTDGANRYVEYPGGERLTAPESSMPDGPIWAGFRPQDADLVAARGAEPDTLVGRVAATTFLGSYLQVSIDIGGDVILVEARLKDLASLPQTGETIGVRIRPQDVMVFTDDAEAQTAE